MQETQKLKERLDQARSEVEIAQRRGDLGARFGAAVRRDPGDREEAGGVVRRQAGERGGDRGTASPASCRAGPASRSTRCWKASATSCCAWKSELRKRVVGQEEALKAVANAVRRARAGLQDPNRPIGSFLFLGPTGVGKTETDQGAGRVPVRRRARDGAHRHERVHGEAHACRALIGAPPGYVGYDEGGVLTEAVRRRPYQVILFDEVEKAHEDVFNVLLQVLDDGRLTDGQGRTVDFKNTIIVLTSNLGQRHPGGTAGRRADGDGAGPGDDASCAHHFRPEFLNRLDEIVLFRRLQRSDMASDRGDPAGAPAQAAGGSQDRAGAGSQRAGVAGERRLRQHLWRAAAEAGDPAQSAEPAGAD